MASDLEPIDKPFGLTLNKEFLPEDMIIRGVDEQRASSEPEAEKAAKKPSESLFTISGGKKISFVDLVSDEDEFAVETTSKQSKPIKWASVRKTALKRHAEDDDDEEEKTTTLVPPKKKSVLPSKKVKKKGKCKFVMYYLAADNYDSDEL